MVPLYFVGLIVVFVVVTVSGSSDILAIMISPAAAAAAVGGIVIHANIRIQQCMSDIFRERLAAKFFQGWLERFGPSRIRGLLLCKRFSLTFDQGLTTSTRCHGTMVVVGLKVGSVCWDFTGSYCRRSQIATFCSTNNRLFQGSTTHDAQAAT